MGEETGAHRIPPRLRRALLGYSRPQVDLLLRDWAEEMRLLGQGLLRAERELGEAWREVAAAERRSDEAVKELGQARRELEEARAALERERQRLRVEAAREAEELKGDALADADQVRRELLDVEALVKVGLERLGELGSANGTRLRIEVGPLGDFERLSRFQDLTAEVVGEAVEIERFSGGRATLSMPGADVGDVLRALEERPDLDFRVRSQGEDTIVLDLDDEK